MSHSLHFKREIIKARRTERNEQEGGNAVMGNLSDVECVCKQIAIFYVNLNLFPVLAIRLVDSMVCICPVDKTSRETQREKEREKRPVTAD